MRVGYNLAAFTPMTLLSVDQARERILSHFQPVTTETLPLAGCSNRVLAQDISATSDFPPFNNSSMDGFAVRAADVVDATPDSPRGLRVVADIPAGSYVMLIVTDTNGVPSVASWVRVDSSANLTPGAISGSHTSMSKDT